MGKHTTLTPKSRLCGLCASEAEQRDSRMSLGQSERDRGFRLLMRAQNYYAAMDRFREERERNKRYCYGDQWGDLVTVDGRKMTEDEYIRKQGRVPLKNNLIRRLVNSVLGVYRSQGKEPVCFARDRDEQQMGETMSTILQCNMQLNRMNDVLARSMEEFLISGFVVHHKSYGWRNGKLDCWTDYVQPNNFFVDNAMRDFRGWDVSMVGEIHDITLGNLLNQFATTPAEHDRLCEIYHAAAVRSTIGSYAQSFGYTEGRCWDFLMSQEPGLCRVIEVWQKEQKPRYRCHDLLNGEIYKIDIADYPAMVEAENRHRMEMAAQNGMAQEEVPLIDAEWFVDDYWYFYYLSPFGDILREGETPYEHGSHPYVFKGYPWIDGEVHSFVGDVVDQQRYTNRLITMYDWIMSSSAKGVLMMPEDSLPDGMSMEDVADEWARYNGVIVFKPSRSGQLPQQIAANSTNIGISELLNLQLKFFEDISGVTGALQGKSGFAGQSAAHYHQQTENATKTLLDILESFSDFVTEGAYKDVKNMQQFYDQKRVFNIAGRGASKVEYDPEKIRDVEFDLKIEESAKNPVYRHVANDMLMQLFQMQAISAEQLLEHGDFPFSDALLQNMKAREEEMAAQRGLEQREMMRQPNKQQ